MCSKAYSFSPNLGSKATHEEQAWPSRIYRQGLVRLHAGQRLQVMLLTALTAVQCRLYWSWP